MLPKTGHGVAFSMDHATKSILGEVDYTRFTMDAFINYSIGGNVFYGRIKTIIMEGTPPLQNMLALTEDAPIYFPTYNLLEEDFVYQSTDKEVVKDRFYLQFKGKGVAVSVNESIDKNVNYLGLTETNIELLLKPNHEVEQIIVLNELGQKIDEVSPSKSQYVSLKKSSTLNLLQFKMKDGSVEVLKLK